MSVHSAVPARIQRMHILFLKNVLNYCDFAFFMLK